MWRGFPFARPCARRSHFFFWFPLVCVCAVATTWQCHDDVHAVRCDHCHHYYNYIIVSIAIIFDIATIANLMSLLLNSDSTRICVTKMKTILAAADATTTSRRPRLRWFVTIMIRQSSWVCFSPQGASIQEAERCSISPKAHEFVAFACCCYLSMWGRACRFADSLLRIAPNWRVQTCSDAFACCCNLLMWSRCCPIAIASARYISSR
jgi:hypothetical protein